LKIYMRFGIGAALAVLGCSAAAEELKPWTVDMTTVMTDENGAAIKDEWTRGTDKDCSHCPSLTLGAAVSHALCNTLPDERNDVPGDQKWAWCAVGARVRSDPSAKLTGAETDLIYRRLSKMYSGIVLLKAMPLIDPNHKVPEIK
jgi:hypothetical protein